MKVHLENHSKIAMKITSSTKSFKDHAHQDQTILTLAMSTNKTKACSTWNRVQITHQSSMGNKREKNQTKEVDLLNLSLRKDANI